jgi:hypothetical protein
MHTWKFRTSNGAKFTAKAATRDEAEQAVRAADPRSTQGILRLVSCEVKRPRSDAE